MIFFIVIFNFFFPTANSLYGDALSKPLPISDYEWVDKETGIKDDIRKMGLFYDEREILNLTDDGKYGFIFEVDLEYPKELHDQHNDYPFCPERRTLPSDAYDHFDIKKIKHQEIIAYST